MDNEQASRRFELGQPFGKGLPGQLSRPDATLSDINNPFFASYKSLLGRTVIDPEEDFDWRKRALCATVDPDRFYPERGGSTRTAKSVCLGCDVRTECLKYALDADDSFGVWGGLSEREWRKLKKRAD